jgi:hypothetical protein
MRAPGPTPRRLGNCAQPIIKRSFLQDVGKRLLGAIIFRKDLFAEVEAKPDLYGPFWLCTTAIFLMAMISNALDWIAYKHSATDAWEGDLKKIAKGASIMYGYVFGGGLALWAWLKLGNNAMISLSALWCIYGMAQLLHTSREFCQCGTCKAQRLILGSAMQGTAWRSGFQSH